MHTPAPDGISRNKIKRSDARANPLSLILLASVLGLGLAGMFGGQPDPVKRAQGEAADISVRAPETLRNGMFFETVVEVTAKRPIEDLTIAVADDLWHQMTINTMLPTAEKEEYRDGFRRFSFGEAEPGDKVRFKVDGQVNPPLFSGTEGEIAAFDGEVRLVGLPVEMKVLP